MKTLRKVLVVDDDPIVGKSFQRVLSNKGYAVVTACDGAEAMRKIAAEEYDVVFTDIRMPGMDGIAVAEQIRARQPWLPVVIVSGYATEENEARAKAAGVSVVLRKPLSPQMIEDGARGAVQVRDAAAMPAATATTLAEDSVAPVESPSVAVMGLGGLKLLGIAIGAPLLGLVYVLVLPFVGLLALLVLPAWFAIRGLNKRAPALKTWAKNVALFLAAPFVGLVYVIALPFVGLGMLAWIGIKFLLGRAHAA